MIETHWQVTDHFPLESFLLPCIIYGSLCNFERDWEQNGPCDTAWRAWDREQTEMEESEKHWEEWWPVRRSSQLSWKRMGMRRWMEITSLHVGLSASVIKDGASDTMIVQEEEVRDNNPWENMNHNDRLCRDDANDCIHFQWRGNWVDVWMDGRKTATFSWGFILTSLLGTLRGQGVL